MNTTAAPTTQAHDEQGTAMTVFVLLLLAASIYAAFFVLDLPLMAGIGFSVIVPSVIGSTISAISRAVRREG